MSRENEKTSLPISEQLRSLCSGKAVEQLLDETKPIMERKEHIGGIDHIACKLIEQERVKELCQRNKYELLRSLFLLEKLADILNEKYLQEKIRAGYEEHSEQAQASTIILSSTEAVKYQLWAECLNEAIKKMEHLLGSKEKIPRFERAQL